MISAIIKNGNLIKPASKSKIDIVKHPHYDLPYVIFVDNIQFARIEINDLQQRYGEDTEEKIYELLKILMEKT